MPVKSSAKLACLFSLCLLAACRSAAAMAPITSQQASDRVLADGFALVVKTEAALGTWNVWASKDGLPYEVKVDAVTGSVVVSTPVGDDD